MPSDFLIKQAARILAGGGIVAYPTEGVYGLGCLPDDGEAVLRLLALKDRRLELGLILIAESPAQLDDYILPLKGAVRKRVLATWPGPCTWIVPAQDDAPPWLTGGRSTIAVRVTAEQTARKLCAYADSALVSTSANRHGHPPARTRLAAICRFGSDVDYVLPGAVGVLAGPTEIRDATTGQVLRAASN